jgi:hypothetical protein
MSLLPQLSEALLGQRGIGFVAVRAQERIQTLAGSLLPVEGVRPKRGLRWILTTVKSILTRNAA